MTSLNLPICAAVIGAQATRTTHPQVVNGFARLFSVLLDRTFTIKTPFILKTKTEILADLKASGHADLIEKSVSCTRTWTTTKLHNHCGTCSQCIDRRLAVLAAGCERFDDVDKYEVELLTGERKTTAERTMIERYIGKATEIADISDATRFFIQSSEACRVLCHMDGRPDDTARQVFELCKRHATKVCEVVDAEIERHASDLRGGGLPTTCLLRLICGTPRTQVDYVPTSDDLLVLGVLASARKTMNQTEIVGALKLKGTPISRRSLGPIVARQEQAGLIEYPQGKPKGAVITARGRNCFSLSAHTD